MGYNFALILFARCDIMISSNICKKSVIMAISYKRLWKLLIDKDIKKKPVQMVGSSSYTINKLNKSENINAETLMKVCVALNCYFDDIMEVVNTNMTGGE